MADITELESLRWDLRQDCVDIIMAGGGGHIGGDMSVIDALMVLYARHLNIAPDRVDDPDRDRFVLLILRAADEHPRTSVRVGLTRDLLADQFARVVELRGGGADALTRVMSLVQYGDYLSCHLAAVKGVDPVPVERIVRLKEALARAKSI